MHRDFTNLYRIASLIIGHGEIAVTQELVDDVIAIGRAQANNIVIDDPTVSAQHASLTKSPTGYRLTDLGSTNGTLINGVPMTDSELKDGDKIRFGSVAAVFQDTVAKFDQTEPLEEASASGKPRIVAPSGTSRKRVFATVGVLAIIAIFIISVGRYQNKQATGQSFDLVELATKTRDAVVLIEAFDNSHHEIATGAVSSFHLMASSSPTAM